MNEEKAIEIIDYYEYYEDKSCICFQGNPPCGKCINCPSKETYDLAIKFVEDCERF